MNNAMDFSDTSLKITADASGINTEMAGGSAELMYMMATAAADAFGAFVSGTEVDEPVRIEELKLIYLQLISTFLPQAIEQRHSDHPTYILTVDEGEDEEAADDSARN